MGSFIRFILAAPLAAIVTLVIFLLMYNQLSPRPFLYQVENQPGKIFLSLSDEPVEIWFCSCGWWLPQMPDTSNPWTDSEKPVAEAPKQQPEKPAANIDVKSARDSGHRVCDADAGVLLDPPLPHYPAACIEKGAEGRVVAQFDITAEGRAVNVQILESPDSCFNQAVISAIERRRFRRYCSSSGLPVRKNGLMESFTFELID